MPSTPARLADRIRGVLREQQEAYAAQAEDERPLAGYAAAIGGFTALSLTVGALSARRGLAPMTSARDVVLLGVATHKLARIISKDAVASPPDPALSTRSRWSRATRSACSASRACRGAS